MDKNDEVYADDWVDGHLAKLSADSEWHPNVAQAFARLNEQRRDVESRGRGRIWALASITLALCILAFPTARNRIRALWDSSHFNGVNIGQVSASVKTLKDGQSAPDFTSLDADGHSVRLSAYKGRVVLLNFWATWCHGCQTEIPWLIEFESKYSDRGLSIIGVSMDDSGWKSVKPFMNEKKMNYPVVIGNDEIAKPYGLSSMPMTFLIDRKGEIAGTSVGVVDKKACESEIVALLAK